MSRPALARQLRTAGVRLLTSEVKGLSNRDVELARQISGVARELDVPADPAAVQHVQIAIDALVTAEIRPFWRAVLGYQQVHDEVLLGALRRGPSFDFQQMDASRPQRNRIHIDIYLPHDQVEQRIAAALAAGGHMVSDANAPKWWTLAAPTATKSTWPSGCSTPNRGQDHKSRQPQRVTN